MTIPFRVQGSALELEHFPSQLAREVLYLIVLEHLYPTEPIRFDRMLL